jgi:hypothetical protein
VFAGAAHWLTGIGIPGALFAAMFGVAYGKKAEGRDCHRHARLCGAWLGWQDGANVNWFCRTAPASALNRRWWVRRRRGPDG